MNISDSKVKVPISLLIVAFAIITFTFPYHDNIVLASEISANMGTTTVSDPVTNTGNGGNSGGSGGGGGGGGGVSSGSSGGIASIAIVKGDANRDGKVDIMDFVILMANWNRTGTNAADFNGDGRVDILDFVQLMAYWTK